MRHRYGTPKNYEAERCYKYQNLTREIINTRGWLSRALLMT